MRCNNPAPRTFCPRHGVCVNCKYVKSMAVGANAQDRVISCSKGSGAPLMMRGYDYRYGNDLIPVYPIRTDCFEMDAGNILKGSGWY